MDIEQILKELDYLFATCQIDRVESYLKIKLEEAAAEADTRAMISLMNEIIGHYRETGDFPKAYHYCGEALKLLKRLGLEGTVPYATTLLNVANAYRAGGRLEESMVQYQAVLLLYQGRIPEKDMRWASLYNNMSLLYQELHDYESACACLEKALAIVSVHNDARIETATTYTNLAASQVELSKLAEAEENLKKAFSIFEMDEERDYHYSAALSVMARIQYQLGNLAKSEAYYKAALHEIKKHTGESKAYEITMNNLSAVMRQMENLPDVREECVSGMQLCERYYEEFGIPMIRTQFPEYESVIAAGLVGEGSECFGYDDEFSRDHDFGPGFCIWLTDQLYDEIGERLQAAYDALPKTYMGVTRYTTPKAAKRVGVFRIRDFYKKLTGLEDVPATQNEWLFVEDYQLACATNGKVFRDGLGEFTRIRNGLLKHYPEEVRVKKIAREAALMAQSGQYNYSRMYGRGDRVTAQIALSEFMKHTMLMVYLLNRKYAPFYKWMHKGMGQLAVLHQIRDILSSLADMTIGDERIPQTIEYIVALIIAEMKKQSLTTGDDNYLDNHTDRILKSIPVKKEGEGQSFKSSLVNELVRLEWEAFDKVENEGGRADCQDDWNTFSIMRKSQYYTWSEEMLRSYIHDFRTANEHGWNLITEKYGRMMASTDPEGYRRIQNRIPVIEPRKQEIIEEIIKIQVDWMEQFALRYPKAASNARSIRTSGDTKWNTSYETYLRGELGTYSDVTLDLYGRFIANLCYQGENLAEMIMTNTAFLYGYASLQDMEDKL